MCAISWVLLLFNILNNKHYSRQIRLTIQPLLTKKLFCFYYDGGGTTAIRSGRWIKMIQSSPNAFASISGTIRMPSSVLWPSCVTTHLPQLWCRQTPPAENPPKRALAQKERAKPRTRLGLQLGSFVLCSCSFEYIKEKSRPAFDTDRLSTNLATPRHPAKVATKLRSTIKWYHNHRTSASFYLS